LDSSLYNPCLQNVQQAVEKLLKALIVESSLKLKKLLGGKRAWHECNVTGKKAKAHPTCGEHFGKAGAGDCP